MSKALGVDVGTERTGIAIEVLGIAQPLTVLTAKDEDLIASITALAWEKGATEIVVGHPLRLDGTEGPAATHAREIADVLPTQSGGIPIVLWDERLTTVQAERTLVEAGVRRRKRRTVVDKLAATVMLQSYLDAGRGKG